MYVLYYFDLRLSFDLFEQMLTIVFVLFYFILI